jgi:hypothetical protein
VWGEVTRHVGVEQCEAGGGVCRGVGAEGGHGGDFGMLRVGVVGFGRRLAASLGLLGASMHPALPRLRAPGPAVRLSGFAPGESVEPVGVLGPHAVRRTNKKAAPEGGLFICVAERGGGTDPKTSLPDCTRDANRTYGPVLCSIILLIGRPIW